MAYMSSTVARNKYKEALMKAEGDLPPFEEWYANQTKPEEPKEEVKEVAASSVPEAPVSSVPETKVVEKKEGFKIPTLDDLLVRGVKKFMSKKEKK